MRRNLCTKILNEPTSKNIHIKCVYSELEIRRIQVRKTPTQIDIEFHISGIMINAGIGVWGISIGITKIIFIFSIFDIFMFFQR